MVGSQTVEWTVPELWTLGKWTHVVVTSSMSARVLYKDGLELARIDGSNRDLPFGIPVVARHNNYFGRSGWAADGYFSGSLAFARVWLGFELGSSEAALLFHQRNNSFSPASASNVNTSPAMSTSKTNSTAKGVVAVKPLVTPPSHSWDFRGCTTGTAVVDSYGDRTLKAVPVNGPVCSSEGLSFDGVDDHVVLDAWHWGGTTSFETFAKVTEFAPWSRIFDFGDGEGHDNVFVACANSQDPEALGFSGTHALSSLLE
jgi:hypothetical protein